MSLSSDARRLAFTPWRRLDGYAECANCGASREADEDRDIVHRPDCPWLSLPAIIEVLEWAERRCGDLDKLFPAAARRLP